MSRAVQRIVAAECAARRGRWRPYLLAAIVATASVALLGLSGWFLAGAALAGVAGVSAAAAFNYMLPAAAIRLMAIARTGARYGERLAGHGLALSVMARVRGRIYGAIAAMPPARALALGYGEATARLVQDVAAVENALIRRPAPWAAGVAVACGAVLAALTGWAAAIAVLLGFAGAFWGARRIARRLAGPGRRVQRATGTLKNVLAEQIAAAPELRCFGLEERALATVERHAAHLALARDAHARGTVLLDLLMPAVAVVLSAVVLGVAAPAGAPLAALAGLAVLATGGELGGAMRALAEAGKVREAERRLNDYFTDAPAVPSLAAPCAAPDVEILAQSCAVRDRLTILSGASGTGKTTLAEMLVGLRPAERGAARVGGVDIANLPAAVLRATFAWMPQDAQLLTGTVRDNLMLARPDGDDALFWAALADAELAERVRAMPRGLDSWVGENGEALSGGEGRRLALARAYCAATPWLLLDEPFAGLDRAMEARVVALLRDRLDRTGQRAILITHGFSGVSGGCAVLPFPPRDAPAPVISVA